MMSKPEPPKSFIEETTATTAEAAGVAVGTQILKLAGASDEVAGAIATVGVATVKNLVKRRMVRREKVLEDAMRAEAERQGVPFEQAIEAAAASAEPAMEQIMFDAYRGLAEAVDDVVVPALGTLAMNYTLSGTSPDAFFRGLGRLLTDLDAAEFRAFQQLVRAIAEAPDAWPREEGAVRMSCRPRLDPTRAVSCVAYRWSDGEIGWKTLIAMDEKVALRLMHLLRANRLGYEPEEPALYGDARKDHLLSVPTATALRVARIIEPVPP